MKRDITERIEESFVQSKAVQAYANALKKPLVALFREGPLKPLKRLLNGTLIGHPLHPLLTDIPIGAWTVGVLLDLLGLVAGVPGLGIAAAIALGFGVLAALATIASGLMDWMDVNPPELAIGAMHGLINSLATLFMAVSVLMRWSTGGASSPAAFVVALVGFLLVTLGGYIGGSLVYRLGVMVNRNAFRAGPDNFVSVGTLKQLPEGQPVRVDAEGEPILLFRQGDSISALGAICSHYGASLEQGKVERGQIECPWHDSHFSLADGSVKAGPATSPLPVYETRIVGDRVQVRLKK